MNGEVDGESDAQDEVGHGHEVHVHIPQGHAPDDANLYTGGGGRHPEGAQDVGHEHQRHEEHTDDGDDHVLQGVGPHHHGLVEVDECLVEDRHPEVLDVTCYTPGLQHSVLRLLKPGRTDKYYITWISQHETARASVLLSWRYARCYKAV